MKALPTRAEVEAAAARQKKRADRELRRHLRDLIVAVDAHLRALDVEMNQPSSYGPKRAARIAKIANALDLANQIAEHYGLGVPLNKLSGARRPGVK